MGNSCVKPTPEKKGPTQFQSVYKMTNVVLGEGAYGKVMLAETLKGQEKVAVKLLDKTQMRERDLSKMHKEVNILKALNHPNVVRVYDFFDDEDYFKIVMEFCDGGELFKKLVSEDQQYTEAKSREIIVLLISALKHCNEHGVVHRDIKPENILLTKDGTIKLADFNLSKQIDPDNVDFKLLETMCGTPNYVAPEVISGKPYDFKCDIWSLGVISFLLLSGGYLPFFVGPDQDKDDLLKKVKKGAWSFSPESAWDGVSQPAKEVVSNMLKKRPSKRMNYEQLLALEWFKETEDLKGDHIIKGSQIHDFYLKHKRQMKTIVNIVVAARTLGDMMGDTKPDNAELQTGTFMESQKDVLPAKPEIPEPSTVFHDEDM